MKTVLAKVRDAIGEHSLFAPGDTVVVAVSGGADSVSLLDILTRLAELRPRLVVAHLNHCLRGAESDGDEQFAAGLAAAHGLPFESEAVDVRGLSIRERLSLEDAGRRARYAFLDRVAERHGARAVALAHHADDQAETVLIRLLRGAGATGLAAMTPRSGRYVRPLLFLTRKEIEGYLRARGLSWRTDSSNADTAFLRNRIRHELIPHLARFNPDISRRLATTAELLAADEEVLEAAAADALERARREGAGGSVLLAIEPLLREPLGLRYRIYRLAVALVKGDLTGLSFSHVRQIDDLVRSPKPNLSCTVPGGVAVVRAYGTVSFGAARQDLRREEEILVEGPGCYPLPGGWEMVVEVVLSPPDVDRLPPEKGCFDLERAPFPWLVRGFRPGDRIRPLGMAGAKKVKDLFIDEKVPLGLRRTVPLVFSNGELVWVCGFRTAAAARITDKTRCAALAEVRQTSRVT